LLLLLFLFCFSGDPSVLRFLIAAREEVDSTQLRDDLLSMLVAGHETTGSALTWTLYLLAQNPQQMQKAQVCCCMFGRY
jgi:carotene epsilon-monooxygenase